MNSILRGEQGQIIENAKKKKKKFDLLTDLFSWTQIKFRGYIFRNQICPVRKDMIFGLLL